MPSDQNPSEQDIEKMLEQARIKTVPPQVLKGFKDDVMRRIAADRRAKPGLWVSPGWKLPRIGMTVGAGALASLFIAAVAVFTTHLPASKPVDPRPALKSVHSDAFEVASLPSAGTLSVPMNAARTTAAASSRAAAELSALEALTAQSAGRASAPSKKLTVEEELRLIEEFDDQRFFIRQDITDDALAAA